MSIETGGSPHSATPRQEQGLSWILWLLDMERWYGDTRQTLRVATQFGQQRRMEGQVNPNRNTMSE